MQWCDDIAGMHAYDIRLSSFLVSTFLGIYMAKSRCLRRKKIILNTAEFGEATQPGEPDGGSGSLSSLVPLWL